jgi:hypothetical protein
MSTVGPIQLDIPTHEWKVSPRGTPIDEVWGQLVAAGVTPTA